jgi:hypothetical protein
MLQPDEDFVETAASGVFDQQGAVVTFGGVVFTTIQKFT